MNKTYHQAYQAPRAKRFELKQSMDILLGFSLEGHIEEPKYESDWGIDAGNSWGRGATGDI
mgnify:FL=1|nr:hypothetical protein [uncultured Porphyromonas sp.]